MSAQPLPSTARAPAEPNKPVGEGWTFRVDDPAGVELDLFRLDCTVEALRGADLAPYLGQLARIIANLQDLQGPTQ